MEFHIFTLFPAVCHAYVQESILKRAQAAGLITVHIHNIRDYATDKHHVTDDLPYGGGGGMVMKPEPVFAAVEALLGNSEQLEVNSEQLSVSSKQLAVNSEQSLEPNLQSPIFNPQSPSFPIILLTPQGRVFSQNVARELAQQPQLVLICGRYEGFDERIRQHLATDEISLGDFVMTGGELGALAIVDAVARLLPGVLGDPTGAEDDSHASGLLEYPHYTRPPEFRGWGVPAVLLSGDHARIAHWRRQESLRRTFLRRPDLLLKLGLSEADKQFLSQVAQQLAG